MLKVRVILFFLEILFYELVALTVIDIALFVALVVTIRKLNNEKHISAGR